ncbi:MAG: ABC transporter permease [Lachnospiraceae bacterium]|jgi:ABC-2 type transport system permease protein|nr:ABC transporter permease [Lachnospiraceae bacterium]
MGTFALSLSNMAAVFKKQLKDTFKNKTVLIQFIMLPVLTLIMNDAIRVEGMPEHFFINLFATMYTGMAPLTGIAAVIAEEKEKNTLRVLRMSNVKPYEYLLGIGGYIWLACMAGASVICAAGSFKTGEAAAFLAVMAAGILISLLVGAAIGIWSKNQMMATSIVLPVMMIFSFLPMLSMFNEDIARVAKFTYTEQVRILLLQTASAHIGIGDIGIILGNVILFITLFALAYKKCGLE